MNEPILRHIKSLFTIILLIVGVGEIHSLTRNESNVVLKDVSKFITANGLNSEYQKVLAKADSLQQVSKLSDNQPYSLLYNFGRDLLFTGKQAIGVEYFRLLLQHFENLEKQSDNDTRFLIDNYICMGAALEELGMGSISMNYYMKGLEVENGKFPRHKAMLQNNIGVLYYNMDVTDTAKTYFLDAVNINLQIKNDENLSVNYVNLSEIALKKNKFNEALDYLLKALQYIDVEKDAKSYYHIHVGLGSLYYKKDDIPMAISYLSNAITHLEKLDYNFALNDAYLQIAEVYLSTDRLDSAQYYNQQSLRLANELQNARFKCKGLDQLSKIEAVKGNLVESNRLLARYAEVRDSLHEVSDKQRVEQWETIYKFRLYGNALEDKEANSKQKIWWTICGVLLFAVVASIVTVLILRHRISKKFATSQLLANSNGDNAESTENPEELLDKRNRELTTFALEKVRTHEFIEDVSEELRGVLGEMNPRDKEHKNRIQTILNKLIMFSNQDTWKEFRYYFEQVHPEFYKSLEEHYPSLTMKDKRMAAFLYLGLSTKEIASITYREVRSVESSRNRLRKKLDLPQEANLTDFFRSLC